jgi:hypothetical protein
MEASMELIYIILSIAAGLLLLFAGRRFFWLAAGLVAFLFTFSLFEALFGGGLFGFIAAIIAGAVLAWLATRFIRIVGYIIGALAGAVGLPIFLGFFGINFGWLLMALAGAAIGFLLMLFLFDWGILLLTAWAGANAVAGNVEQWFRLGATLATIVFVVLLVLGVAVQAGQMRGKK